MGIIVVLAEAVLVLTMAWLGACIPLWLLLAAATYLGDRRACAIAPWCDPQTGRSVRTMAFAVVGTAACTAIAFTVAGIYAPAGRIAWLIVGLWGVAVVLEVVLGVMSAVLTVRFIALIREVFTKRCRAGRDAVVAYAMVLSAFVGIAGMAYLSAAP